MNIRRSQGCSRFPRSTSRRAIAERFWITRAGLVCRPHSYPEFMQRSNGPYLASSVSEETPVANSEERLHSILTTLEECRAALFDSANGDTAQLLSVAILELRMKLNQIADSELKALCDAMLPDEAPAERLRYSKSRQAQRRRPLLKLVKS